LRKPITKLSDLHDLVDTLTELAWAMSECNRNIQFTLLDGTYHTGRITLAVSLWSIPDPLSIATIRRISVNSPLSCPTAHRGNLNCLTSRYSDLTLPDRSHKQEDGGQQNEAVDLPVLHLPVKTKSPYYFSGFARIAGWFGNAATRHLWHSVTKKGTLPKQGAEGRCLFEVNQWQ